MKTYHVLYGLSFMFMCVVGLFLHAQNNTGAIFFTIVGVPVFVLAAALDVKSHQAEQVAQKKEEEKKVSKAAMVEEASSVFEKYNFELSPLNKNQARVLFVAMYLGEDKLTITEILKVWGWDGSRLHYLKFLQDFAQISCSSRFRMHRGFSYEGGMIDGWDPSESPDNNHSNETYSLKKEGLTYLREKGFV